MFGVGVGGCLTQNTRESKTAATKNVMVYLLLTFTPWYIFDFGSLNTTDFKHLFICLETKIMLLNFIIQKYNGTGYIYLNGRV